MNSSQFKSSPFHKMFREHMAHYNFQPNQGYRFSLRKPNPPLTPVWLPILNIDPVETKLYRKDRKKLTGIRTVSTYQRLVHGAVHQFAFPAGSTRCHLIILLFLLLLLISSLVTRPPARPATLWFHHSLHWLLLIIIIISESTRNSFHSWASAWASAERVRLIVFIILFFHIQVLNSLPNTTIVEPFAIALLSGACSPGTCACSSDGCLIKESSSRSDNN